MDSKFSRNRRLRQRRAIRAVVMSMTAFLNWSHLFSYNKRRVMIIFWARRLWRTEMRVLLWNMISSILDSDSSSVASSTELNDFGKQAANVALMSNQGDFFDANEDFFPDGSSSYGPCMESELRATRLSLLEEIERRKALEEALGQMYIEQFCQQLLVARFVAEAMGKGQARAEAEIAAEEIIGSKDQEISRLRDRLQYYEAVNHEMSQRNQEIIEVARRQRQMKKRRSRWLWGCVGLSVAVGISVIAYSYLPQTSELHPRLISGDSSDASCLGLTSFNR
ncbi:hypothetical protein F0562_020126 [Nyssa sinensis]|uniref:Uncharacterized protein n=1 Tax=Nyssa sinensis TaxID=561372 RepID=A0A5J5BUT3_9ASTE|nr:hypothetical protein F0562_020126 [Nyssa sinensis]